MPNQISPWESDEIAPVVSVTITLRKLTPTDFHTLKSEAEKATTSQEDQDKSDKSHYKDRKQPLDSGKMIDENVEMVGGDENQPKVNEKAPKNYDFDQEVVKDNSDRKVVNSKL